MALTRRTSVLLLMFVFGSCCFQAHLTAAATLGLVLPTSTPASRAGAAAAAAPDTLSEAEYVALLRRHDAEEADDWHNESQLYDTNDLGMPAAQLVHRSQPGAEAGFSSSGSGSGGQQQQQQQQRAGAAWHPVPLELSAAQPVMAVAASLTQEVWASLQQAHSTAAQLLQALPSRAQQPLRALDVDISSSSAAGVGAIRMGSSEGMLIDLTVSSSSSGGEGQEGLRVPSALFDNTIVPAVMAAATGGSVSSTDGSADGQLAVQLTRSVIESALATRDAGNQQVLLDLTVDNVDLAEARRIMAAASSAAAAGQEASGWDRVELQVDLLDTPKPASSWTCCWMGVASALLTLQLVGCLLWVLLSRGDNDGAAVDGDASSDTGGDVRSRRDQGGGWSVMAAAEEGRGVYQKLLSHA